MFGFTLCMQELQSLEDGLFIFPGKKHSSHLIKVEVVVRIHNTKCLNSAVYYTVNLLCLRELRNSQGNISLHRLHDRNPLVQTLF